MKVSVEEVFDLEEVDNNCKKWSHFKASLESQNSFHKNVHSNNNSTFGRI
jgi:hypothetical protein